MQAVVAIPRPVIKNICLCFEIAVSAIALIGGLAGHDDFSMVAMLPMLPVLVITIFVSCTIHRPIAHLLNLIPMMLCFPLLVVVIMGEQTPLGWIWVLGFMARLSVLLMIGVMILWLTALWIGVDEPGNRDPAASDEALKPSSSSAPPRAWKPLFARSTHPCPPEWDQ